MSDSAVQTASQPQGSHPQEIEWQFDALDLRPVARWLSSEDLQAPTDGEHPTMGVVAKEARRQVDRYLDTTDWRVVRAGLVLRSRRRGSHEEVTLKDRGTHNGALRVRLEITETLPKEGLDGLGTEGPVGRRLAALVGHRPLEKVLEIRTRRRPFTLLAGEQELAELDLDETTIVSDTGTEPARLRRVEVEAKQGSVEKLEPFVHDLQATCGLQVATLSKFEAGLLALGLTVPGPPDLGPTNIGSDPTLGELAFAVIRRHLGVLLAKEPGTRLGEDPEELHDMRVASRRLRAALSLFADVLPVRAHALGDELRWVTSLLGHVRDLDVQLARLPEMAEWTSWITEPGTTGDPIQGSPLAQLEAILQAERDAARRDLVMGLDSQRWERLAAGLSLMAERGPLRRSPASRTPAVLVVPDLVEPRHRAARKAARRTKKSGLPTDFHRLRIRCKRLRYSLEFVRDVYGGPVEHFTRQLARLQDTLGLLQDAEVASRRLLSLATNDSDPLAAETIFAIGGVAQRHQAEAANLLRRAPKQVKILKGKDWTESVELMERRRSHAIASTPPPRATRTGPAAPEVPPPTDVSEKGAAPRTRPASAKKRPVAPKRPTRAKKAVGGARAARGRKRTTAKRPSGRKTPLPVKTRTRTREARRSTTTRPSANKARRTATARPSAKKARRTSATRPSAKRAGRTAMPGHGRVGSGQKRSSARR